ncbi:MAG: hypothetical protein C5B49_03525 [Bdellovibrio sp.]|nr:MAG: hypothetical protein C5B49_03525 [Bdellovibrio sp.]
MIATAKKTVQARRRWKSFKVPENTPESPLTGTYELCLCKNFGFAILLDRSRKEGGLGPAKRPTMKTIRLVEE